VTAHALHHRENVMGTVVTLDVYTTDGNAGDPYAVGVVRRAEQPAALGQVRQPGPRDNEADIQHYLVAHEHDRSKPARVSAAEGTSVLAMKPYVLSGSARRLSR
jgi:hypothetical protein